MTVDQPAAYTVVVDGGRRVCWAEFGDPGGVPVVFFHGTPGGRLNLARQAASLARQGLLVITPDRPGYGSSDPAPGRNVGDTALDTIALLDARGIEKTLLLGGSGGGPHALAVAAHASDRVQAVGVMAGAAPLTVAEREAVVGVNQQVLASIQEPDALRSLVAEIRRMLLEQGLTAVLADAPEQDRKLFEQDLAQREAAMRDALARGSEGMYDDYRAIFGLPWGFEPADVTVPVVWAHGDEDRNVPMQSARRYADQLPDCRFQVWEGVGHAMPAHLQVEVHTAILAASMGHAAASS